MAFDWRYVPLNVKTYREAYNRLAGPICVSLLAIITGFLLLSYEVGMLAPRRQSPACSNTQIPAGPCS